MSSPKTISEALIKEIIERREKEHLSYQQLSKIYGFSASGIQRKVLRYEKPSIDKFKDISEELKDKVVYNYLYLNMGTEKAGVEYGISGFLVKKILHERGVTLRNYTESKQAGRKYTVNDNFFKTQGPDMAYLLGFLAADGNVSKAENGVTIQLQESDKDFLELIRAKVESSRPIKFYLTNAGKPTCKLEVWSSEWKKDLAIYNIVPNKTFILQPPDRLNPRYYIDYIRGYFDGDGSIYVNNSKYAREFAICGASKDLIYWMYRELVKLGVENLHVYTTYTANNVTMYELSTKNKEAVKQIGKLMYYDDNVFCLDRKRKKFNLID